MTTYLEWQRDMVSSDCCLEQMPVVAEMRYDCPLTRTCTSCVYMYIPLLILSAETLVAVVVFVVVVAVVVLFVPVLVSSCLFPPAAPFVWLPRPQSSPPPPKGAQRSNRSAEQQPTM